MKNRQQLFAWIAAAVVALWAGERLLFSPLVRLWNARSAQLRSVRRSVQEGETLLERASAIRERWALMNTNLLSPEASIAESQMIKAFDRWSRDSGVSVSGIRPQWKPAETGVLLPQCRAEASGNLSALTRFLYQADREPLAIRVESIELTTRDNRGEQLTLSLQVSGLPRATPER